MRNDLPTGTVTFLFTDVEGSTRLLEELGAEGYAAVNEVHRRAVREVLARHDGVEVSTHGDAFFAVFTDTVSAMRAAATAQELLADGRLRVRMGLHRGTAVIADDTYVGMDVNRAARIADAAHGGQVLVSPEVRTALDDSMGLTDLGEQRLKDLSEPVRLFQLGNARFPPLRVLHHSYLPVPATPFLGREAELAEVASLLSREDARIITLTGPGGTGKTRLGLQAAAEASGGFPDGLYWVPLAPLRDPGLVLATVAEAMSVKEQADTSPLEGLAETFAGKSALLLLDNAEHLMPSLASDIAALAVAVPTLTMVVTSRERLRVAGEQVYAVPPLEEGDGVELFLARARSLDPSLPHSSAVDELCERLEHLPLALELAAARIGLLSPEQLLERLGGRLDVLKGGHDADPRQQTLRATIEWSYDLLSPTEQEALACMSVFAGGSTLGAAEEVCGSDLDTLQSLLDKSLIRRRDTERGPRLWMLETIREFAAERLVAKGAADDAVRRHLAHYLELAVLVDEQSGTQEWDLDRIEDERDNMRIALDTALATDPVRALELAGRLAPYWSRRGHNAEGRERLRAALAAAPDAPSQARARALRWAGGLAKAQADLVTADRLGREALVLDQELGDSLGASLDLSLLGVVAMYRGDHDEAVLLFEDSLREHRRLEQPTAVPDALAPLAAVLHANGDLPRAIELGREAVAGFRKHNNQAPLALALNNLGMSLEGAGETEEARRSLQESIELARSRSLPDTLAYALASLAHLELAEHPAASLAYYQESVGLLRELEDPRGIAYCLEGLATLALTNGGTERAVRLLSSAARLREESGATLTGTERAEVDATTAAARALLGEEAFTAAWSAGRGTGFDQAVELALSLTADV